MLHGKAMIVILTVELDLSNYVTKKDLRNVAGVDTSDLSKKTDLANLKFEVDKLDIDKLKNVPSGLNSLKNKVDKLDVNKIVPPSVDLSKLIDAVKNVVKKMFAMLRLKILQTKYLKLVTQLLILLLMLK